MCKSHISTLTQMLTQNVTENIYRSSVFQNIISKIISLVSNTNAQVRSESDRKEPTVSQISVLDPGRAVRYKGGWGADLRYVCARGGGGGTWIFRGAHTLVIKIKKYP